MKIDQLRTGIPFRATTQELESIRLQMDERNNEREAMDLGPVELTVVPFKTDEWILVECEVAHEQS